MEALSKLKEIKKLLGFSVEEEVPAVAFAESTLVDGTVVRFPGDSLEIGSVLEVQTPEGEYVPAPDGTHETSDGLLITTEGGVITAIEPKEVEEEMKKDGSKEDVVKAFTQLEKFQVDENIKIVLKALMEYCFGWELREEEQKQIREAAIQSYKQGFSAIDQKIDNLTQAQAKTVEVIEQFSAIPAAEPVKPIKASADKKEESLARFSQALKQLKNKQ